MSGGKQIKPGWHRGPPPEIGWWPASTACDPNSIRWWNGKRWGAALQAGFQSERTLNFWATADAGARSTRIFWTERWWLK
jgi:hypothetical protein